MANTKTARPSFSNSSTALLAVPYSITPGESRNFDLTTSSQNVSTGSTSDPAYLFSQVNQSFPHKLWLTLLFLQLKSIEWIRRYGLKSQKLTFDQILQQIGFKRVESKSIFRENHSHSIRCHAYKECLRKRFLINIQSTTMKPLKCHSLVSHRFRSSDRKNGQCEICWQSLSRSSAWQWRSICGKLLLIFSFVSLIDRLI